MPERTGFTIDTKDFDVKFSRVTERQIPEAAAKSFFRVASMVIRDAIQEKPRAPHKTGHLWRSQKIEQPTISHGEVSIELGFNTPYAARLHETLGSWDWTLVGSGPKFLETKLAKNKEKYMKAEADGIKDKAK